MEIDAHLIDRCRRVVDNPNGRGKGELAVEPEQGETYGGRENRFALYGYDEYERSSVLRDCGHRRRSHLEGFDSEEEEARRVVDALAREGISVEWREYSGHVPVDHVTRFLDGPGMDDDWGNW